MIYYKEGNLLDMFEQDKFDCIAHGANCFNIMGAGIADQIRNRFPIAYVSDKLYHLSPLERLGNFSYGDTDHGVVYNLYTQFSPGPHATLAAIELAFQKLNHFIDKDHLLGIPKIGCGIGGLNWVDVAFTILSVYKHDIIVVNYKQ